MTKSTPLFERYPTLHERLPRVYLASLPTPVERLTNLEKLGYGGRLYIKRDDLSGQLYGGNKTRKLEFLLGEARQSKKKRIVTFGFAGSNHALATAIYARDLDIECNSMLMPQPNSHIVRKNLLISYGRKARLHFNKNFFRTTIKASLFMIGNGRNTIMIPPGGSSPLGNCGYINAAFELQEQIDKGELPKPDLIYLPAGTMGTATGLILGLKAVGLKSRVVPVQVVDRKFTNKAALYGLLQSTNTYLTSLDPSFPSVVPKMDELFMEGGYYGEQYGLYTEQGMDAVRLIERHEGIKLEGTYTGKTFAAFLNDTARPQMKDKTILFWNTFNSRDLSAFAANVDYRDLPKPFHIYFTEDVQPLDSLS